MEKEKRRNLEEDFNNIINEGFGKLFSMLPDMDKIEEDYLAMKEAEKSENEINALKQEIDSRYAKKRQEEKTRENARKKQLRQENAGWYKENMMDCLKDILIIIDGNGRFKLSEDEEKECQSIREQIIEKSSEKEAHDKKLFHSRSKSREYAEIIKQLEAKLEQKKKEFQQHYEEKYNRSVESMDLNLRNFINDSSNDDLVRLDNELHSYEQQFEARINSIRVRLEKTKKGSTELIELEHQLQRLNEQLSEIRKTTEKVDKGIEHRVLSGEAMDLDLNNHTNNLGHQILPIIGNSQPADHECDIFSQLEQHERATKTVDQSEYEKYAAMYSRL